MMTGHLSYDQRTGVFAALVGPAVFDPTSGDATATEPWTCDTNATTVFGSMAKRSTTRPLGRSST